MVIDLIMLIVIGCLLEGFVTKTCGFVLGAAPTFTFSFFITILAVVRWNLKGLLVIPFLAAATWIGGMNNDIPYLAAIYDWRIFVSNCVGLLGVAVNVIFFKKYKTKKVVYNNYALVGIVLLDAVLYEILFMFTYRMLTSGNPIVMGSIPFDAMTYDKELEKLVETRLNLCYYVENASTYNLLGLGIAFIGLFILRSQGAVNNVVDKLIDDKNDEIILRNAEYFSIPEEDEESENLNQNDSEEN